jgi:hypothetical protein
MYCFSQAESEIILQKSKKMLKFTSPVKIDPCWACVREEAEAQEGSEEESEEDDCEYCLQRGISLNFCRMHRLHDGSSDGVSHYLLLSTTIGVSTLLRSNEMLCDGIQCFNEQELAEAVAICAQEKWSSGDLFGDSFQQVQIRAKLRRHFMESKNRAHRLWEQQLRYQIKEGILYLVHM